MVTVAGLCRLLARRGVGLRLLAAAREQDHRYGITEYVSRAMPPSAIL
jgi:hypothetical protein